MSRRVSKPVAALLALVISLSAESALAMPYGRDLNPGFGTRITRILKQFGRKLGIIGGLVEWPAPPIP